ncbi:hypothetical protein AA0616_3121 [Komagataeibacter nataicola NRIC 0616]|uniref:hypothetical protein n=1 Tax=Komagataeibacter nataicola TaxID=265960 RepID=UPI002156B786|nr:hypothetical protein [Komagataeibacter nataicola]WNM08622.1 hypothetical protein RI056_17685 [Komagataeibacter nataicola]GBR26076.1 hypothetical protein AA0616_3121 [Komagataeibacter nataicola NRIC 0616]
MCTSGCRQIGQSADGFIYNGGIMGIFSLMLMMSVCSMVMGDMRHAAVKEISLLKNKTHEKSILSTICKTIPDYGFHMDSMT